MPTIPRVSGCYPQRAQIVLMSYRFDYHAYLKTPTVVNLSACSCLTVAGLER